MIELCKSYYKIPVAYIHALTQGRAYKVGAGLDRAKSLIGGDNTIWTLVLKLASPQHGEPEFYLLNQVAFTLNTARAIKKQILADHEKYHLDAVTLENYETADLSPWLSDMKIPHELVSAHDTNQNASFTELHRICPQEYSRQQHGQRARRRFIVNTFARMLRVRSSRTMRAE